MADRGWTAPETRPCYDRARELCARIGDTEGLFPVLYGQFSHHLSRGEADAAHGLALQTLQLTEASGDAALRSMAHSMLGMSLFSRGELAAALEPSADRALARSARRPFPHLPVARPQRRHRLAVARSHASSSRLSGAGRRGTPMRGCGPRARSPTRTPWRTPWRSPVATTRCWARPRRSTRPPRSWPRSRPSTASRSMPPPRRSIAAGCCRPDPTSPAASKSCARAWRPSWISARWRCDLIFPQGSRVLSAAAGAARRRTRSSRQGPGAGRAVRPALVRGGDPPFERRTAVALFRCAAGRVPPSAEPRDGAPAGCPALGTAGRLQPRPAVARAGPARRRPRAPRADPCAGFAEGFDAPDLKEARALLDALSGA